MAQASQQSVLCTAVYDQLDAALADMKVIEELHKEKLIGDYDAAVILQEEGQPHIVDRADHPAIRVIPEALGSGPLSHRSLHDAARALDADEVALVAVGEATLEKGFERAVTRAARTAKQTVDGTTDELAKELIDASKSTG